MSNQKWILVAEDNEHDADLTVRALIINQSPDNILIAHDGAEALDCLYRRNGFHGRELGPPAVLLLDLKMPKVDGLEVLRQIKADARLRTIPVVVFTSSREESDLTRSYDLGANAYVVKPVDYQKFVAAVKEVRKFWMVLNELPAHPGREHFKQTQLASAA